MSTALEVFIVAVLGVAIGHYRVGRYVGRWLRRRRKKHAEFIERTLSERLKTMTGKSPEEMVREAVVDRLMRLATAVRADHVTGIEFTWKEGEYPSCSLKLRAPANQIVLETDIDMAGPGEKGGD